MIASRFASLNFICLVVATASVAESPASHEAAQTVAVVEDKDLRIDLKVLRKASLSDRDWLAIEFRNLGTKPLVVKNVLQEIAREAVTHHPLGGVAAGTPASFTGEKTSWHGFDRFDFLMDDAALTVQPIKASPLRA